MTYKHFRERSEADQRKQDAYSMKANAATAPAKPRPALRFEAAPVLSGRVDLVAEGALLVALAMRLLGTERGLLGWRTVELPAGTPVL
jgi:hypothetical protein